MKAERINRLMRRLTSAQLGYARACAIGSEPAIIEGAAHQLEIAWDDYVNVLLAYAQARQSERMI